MLTLQMENLRPGEGWQLASVTEQVGVSTWASSQGGLLSPLQPRSWLPWGGTLSLSGDPSPPSFSLGRLLWEGARLGGRGVDEQASCLASFLRWGPWM